MLKILDKHVNLHILAELDYIAEEMQNRGIRKLVFVYGFLKLAPVYRFPKLAPGSKTGSRFQNWLQVPKLAPVYKF